MADTQLKPGDPAPQFTAVTDTGEKLSLKDLKGKTVILYFYPKDDTPGCTTQACGFRDEYETIDAAGAVVLGVSPDGTASHQKFKNKFDLPFSLLVDEDHSIAEAYGVWGEKKMYGKSYMGIIRSHFVIDENGKLKDVQIKVSPKDSVSKALESLKA
jgi:peroxiredoxin Q/BCP